MKGYIYCLELPNGRRYVGQTTQDLKERWGYGTAYDNTQEVGRWIKKVGWEEIKKWCCETVEEPTLEKLKKKLCQREVFWGKKLNSLYPMGLNKRLGGYGCSWTSDELVESAARKQREYYFLHPEIKGKISKESKERWKKNRRLMLKCVLENQEKTQTAESRRKQGVSLKHYWTMHPEEKADRNRKIGDANRGSRNGIFGKTPWNKGKANPYAKESKYEKEWEKVKALFEAGESLYSIGRKFGCDSKSIKYLIEYHQYWSDYEED